MVETIHPNMSLLMQLDIQHLDACKDLFADNFTWRYFNSELPELDGNHIGIEGLKGFFATLGEITRGSFHVKEIESRPLGDEFVVTHVCDSMTLDGNAMALDAVVIWRIVDGKIAEAWDIPAINSTRSI